jgi:Flp pilus assembly protein TadG
VRGRLHRWCQSRGRDDRGVNTMGVMLGLTLLILAFIGLANFVVFQYGRGALRTAVEQAARAGSRASADVAACEQRGHEALDAVLGGEMGGDATLSCTVSGDEVHAEAQATFVAWLDLYPDWTVTVSATAQKEQEP